MLYSYPAKVPRRAARLATARIEQSSLKYKLLIRQSQWPSSGDLSSQRGVQPSNLQHATQKVPRPTGDSSTQKVPKAVGSHLENSDDDVDVPAQSSKKPKSQESPDRVLQQPVLKSDTEYSDDVDDLVQSRNAKLQKLRDTVPKKPMSKSDAEESDDVDDLAQSKKPGGKTRNRQYKCSVKGCPHTSNDHIGFWLFSLPDEEDEASLHSAWLQSVPIDLDINRPLSPRVCFKHFDVKKDFVSVCKRMVGLKPTAVPSKVPRKGHQSQSMTAAEATQKLEFTIDTDVGRGSQTTTATDRGNELESTTVVAMNHESRPTTGAGKGQESEPVSIVGTAQESQTMTAASMDSESQCTSAITSPPELASDSNSKSAAESWPTLQASPAQLTGENSGAGQLKKDDATNGSKPEEQKRDGACSLASHGPVDDAGSTTASHCASPEGNRDSDVDSNVCGLPKCVPKKMCDALTQPVLVTDNETQDAMLSKLQIDLEAPPQVSKDAVASSVSVQMCSTNKRADASNDRMDKEGMKITTERHNLDPQHVKSDHKSDASITAIRTAAKVHPTLDAPTKPLLRKEVTVSNVAMLSRGPSNLVHSINSEMKRNEQDGICKSRLPNFFSQSYGSDRRDDRHVSSHAFNLPVVKAAVDAKSWPNVSEEPSASCSAIVRHRPDFPGGSSTDEAEKSKPTNPATASHLFDPSQGRYVLKKEVLQDGDELGMSAVLCTVVWVPKGGAN
ncbi:hypothetical protein HPB49_019432 [Dermacentor silvarum]|uniref:Uncharacterized protein n=1 Tax=Dermacentor silvarum TaxID=543639 RepID=A0ACB8C540_DERSI|nr:hypothetical protein HPB49_019432 [Dermacentor silvarum]